jgi:hypothetical protein
MRIHLVRDCLDKQVIDRQGRKTGRVDGITIETSGAGRPRLTSIEIGSTTLATRMPTRISKCLKWIIARLSGSRENTLTVTTNKIDIRHNEVHIALDSDSTEVRALEHWLRDRIVTRIPGG